MGLRGVVGALLLVFALGGNVRAATSSGFYSSTKISCADFLGRYSAEISARNANHYGGGDQIFTPQFVAAVNYVAGWTSAYNLLTPDTYDILPNGILGALLWLNNYCAKNPLQHLDDGLRALVIEAYPSRQQKPPGQ
jgi:hypothetical protein